MWIGTSKSETCFFCQPALLDCMNKLRHGVIHVWLATGWYICHVSLPFHHIIFILLLNNNSQKFFHPHSNHCHHWIQCSGLKRQLSWAAWQILSRYQSCYPNYLDISKYIKIFSYDRNSSTMTIKSMTGISGLSTAYKLNKVRRLTQCIQEEYKGGRQNTITYFSSF